MSRQKILKNLTSQNILLLEMMTTMVPMHPGLLLQIHCVIWIRAELFWKMLGGTFMEIILVRLEYYNHCEH